MTIKSPLKQVHSNVEALRSSNVNVDAEELLDVTKPKLTNEWKACFDPINTSMNSDSPLLLKRVHFGLDGDGEILQTVYDDSREDFNVRDQWYTVADFRSFRAACHATAAMAAADQFYIEHFEALYAACSGSSGAVPEVDVDDATEFSDYRGVERVTFRNHLQTDKIASIRGVVWTQEDAMAVSDDTLATVCHKLTRTARKIALYAAAADAIVARNNNDLRYIEI